MTEKIPRGKRSRCILGILALLLPIIALTLPHEAVSATITCSNGLSGCHFNNNKVQDGTTRNAPAGMFTGLPIAQLEALLAHELAHVVQQSGADTGQHLMVGPSHDRNEQEAESVRCPHERDPR